MKQFYIISFLFLFIFLNSSKLLSRTNGGLNAGYGYITQEKLGSTKIGGQSLFMIRAVAHWKIIGFSMEFPLFTRYPYGKNSKVAFINAKTMVGYRFSESQGYFFPYFSGGIGGYLREGVDKYTTNLSEIEIVQSGLQISYGIGIILSVSNGGLYIDYSILDTEYQDGKVKHGLFQVGIILSR